MKKQAILIALIILSSLSISAKDIVVINSENGKPLVGAKAFTENDSLISNRYGELSNSEITSVDFVTYNNIHLNSTLQNDTLVVDFPFTLESPKKLGTIEGKVTDKIGKGLPIIGIELTKDGFSYKCYTEANGDYSFDYLSVGNWNITVHKSKDYDSYDSEIEVNPNDKLVQNHQIILENYPPPIGSISGVVFDEDGNPAVNASVLVVGTTKVSKVNPKGYFKIDSLKKGLYKLKASSQGYSPIVKEISIEDDNVTDVEFNLTVGFAQIIEPKLLDWDNFQDSIKSRKGCGNIMNPTQGSILNQPLNDSLIKIDNSLIYGSIAGEVHDEHGNPAVGASVIIVGTTKGAIVKVSGEFVIENVRKGEYELKISSIGYDPIMKKVFVYPNNKTKVNFELSVGSVQVDELVIIDRASSASGGSMNNPLAPRKVVTSSSGVTTSGKGYSVRGSRANSTQVQVNGLDPGNQFTGGYASSNNEIIEAGQLTSGEVNDFRKWEMWSDIAKDELSSYIDDWGIEPTNRYTVQLTSLDNRPVIDARVNLINQIGKVIWSARSDNTGKAELWADAYNEIDDDTSGLAVEVFYKGKRKFERNISAFKDGINFIQVDEYCSQPNKVDILFAMDATGSMGDEIEYLKTELLDIIDRLEQSNNDIDLRIGSLFYRDYDYPFSQLLSTHDLTDDISSVNEFINSEKAISGNSTPEAVDVALSSALNEFTWSDDAIARIMFLILDAPPHSDEQTMRRFKELTAKAAEMGIRIIPLVASGINKSDEYLMRSVALLTNGTYLFLTDDSGIGNSHIKPTTDSYDVEMMNEMIVRIINQFIDVPKCGSDEIEYANKIEDKIYNKQETINQDISEYIKIYPNPTDGPLTLSLQEEYDNLFVVDMNGKILFKVEAAQGDIQVNLSNFPSGAYFLKYNKDGAWGSTQLQLIR
ncbi:MAG: carboxypeptidase regulatory-like domain-containing protein [Chlorobiota bacterium]